MMENRPVEKQPDDGWTAGKCLEELDRLDLALARLGQEISATTATKEHMANEMASDLPQAWLSATIMETGQMGGLEARVRTYSRRKWRLGSYRGTGRLGGRSGTIQRQVPCAFVGSEQPWWRPMLHPEKNLGMVKDEAMLGVWKKLVDIADMVTAEGSLPEGGRSLLATAERLVPGYIQLGRFWGVNGEGEENGHFEAQVFDALESLGPGGSWRMLRKGLWSQAVARIRYAMKKGDLTAGDASAGLLLVDRPCLGIESFVTAVLEEVLCRFRLTGEQGLRHDLAVVVTDLLRWAGAVDPPARLAVLIKKGLVGMLHSAEVLQEFNALMHSSQLDGDHTCASLIFDQILCGIGLSKVSSIAKEPSSHEYDKILNPDIDILIKIWYQYCLRTPTSSASLSDQLVNASILLTDAYRQHHNRHAWSHGDRMLSSAMMRLYLITILGLVRLDFTAQHISDLMAGITQLINERSDASDPKMRKLVLRNMQELVEAEPAPLTPATLQALSTWTKSLARIESDSAIKIQHDTAVMILTLAQWGDIHHDILTTAPLLGSSICRKETSMYSNTNRPSARLAEISRPEKAQMSRKCPRQQQAGMTFQPKQLKEPKESSPPLALDLCGIAQTTPKRDKTCKHAHPPVPTTEYTYEEGIDEWVPVRKKSSTCRSAPLPHPPLSTALQGRKSDDFGRKWKRMRMLSVPIPPVVRVVL